MTPLNPTPWTGAEQAEATRLATRRWDAVENGEIIQGGFASQEDAEKFLAVRRATRNLADRTGLFDHEAATAPTAAQAQGGWNQPPQQYGPYQQGSQPYQPPPGPPGSRTPGVAVAALLCGIFALLVSWVPIIGLVAFPLGIAAVVMGVIGLRKSREPGYGGRGRVIGGLVTGALGLVNALLITAAFISTFDDPGTQGAAEDPEAGSPPSALAVGEAAVLEDLEVSVTQLDVCGRPVRDDDADFGYIWFVRAEVLIRNVGDEPMSLYRTDWYVEEPSGERSTPDGYTDFPDRLAPGGSTTQMMDHTFDASAVSQREHAIVYESFSDGELRWPFRLRPDQCDF